MTVSFFRTITAHYRAGIIAACIANFFKKAADAFAAGLGCENPRHMARISKVALNTPGGGQGQGQTKQTSKQTTKQTNSSHTPHQATPPPPHPNKETNKQTKFSLSPHQAGHPSPTTPQLMPRRLGLPKSKPYAWETRTALLEAWKAHAVFCGEDCLGPEVGN